MHMTATRRGRDGPGLSRDHLELTGYRPPAEHHRGLGHLRAARLQLLHHGAEVLFIDVDDEGFVRLHRLSSDVFEDDLRARKRELKSFAPHILGKDRQVKLAAAADDELVEHGRGFTVQRSSGEPGSIGRTDLPGGSMDKIMRSLHTQVLALPDETQVVPGHGPGTTIGKERETNPFLQK